MTVSIPRFIVRPLSSLFHFLFFTRWSFVAILCWASLSAPFFQQHLLTLCLCHILVIFIRFHTFSLFLHLLMVICDHHLLYCSNLELNLQYLRGMPVCLISLWIPSEWMKVLVAQSCLTLCNPMDYSPPGSSVLGALWARILKWVTIPFSRGSSQPRNQTWVSLIAGRFFTSWATREAPVNEWRND